MKAYQAILIFAVVSLSATINQPFDGVQSRALDSAPDDASTHDTATTPEVAAACLQMQSGEECSQSSNDTVDDLSIKKGHRGGGHAGGSSTSGTTSVDSRVTALLSAIFLGAITANLV
jgi:hypothetical protein